jgi:hypothetical protein
MKLTCFFVFAAVVLCCEMIYTIMFISLGLFRMYVFVILRAILKKLNAANNLHILLLCEVQSLF